MTQSRRRASAPERRTRHLLREALDELVQHVRVVCRTLPGLPPDQLAHSQERLEWLADEVWRLALEDDAERS